MTPPTNPQLSQIRSRRRVVRRWAAITVAAMTTTKKTVTIRLENSIKGWSEVDTVRRLR